MTPKRLAPILLMLLGAPGAAMAVEEPQYRIERDYGTFEVRVYEPVIVAETVVTGAFGDGTNEGFRRLAGYIFGANDGGRKIAMTAPVGAEPAKGTKIAMTAPVGAEKGTNGWIVTFTMPSSFTMKSLPVPDDARVRLREVPARRVAAVRFSGTWGAEKFEDAARKVTSDAKSAGLVPADAPPVFARYDPPWTPWFMRRNEVLIPLAR
ncbi:MAG: heme-binding protein [Thermoanaerobaculia bacterium]